MSIVLAVVIVTVLGLVGAAILVVAGHFLHVAEDERIGLVADALPGANCGACGFAGCADYAKGIVEQDAPVNKCIPGGNVTSQAVAAIMGVVAGEVVARKAVVACQGNYTNTTNKYEYEGIKTCSACNLLFNGRGACKYGCLGYGDCALECKFGAIQMINGVAVVDPEKCTGCGECTKVCPNALIYVVTDLEKPMVLCKNKDRGALTRKDCSAGCIGCMKCQKICPTGAITVTNNNAVIDESKCINCQECVNVCPVNAISNSMVVEPVLEK